MKSNTSLVARNYRLQEWANQIQECKSRPKGMKVKEWCSDHEITVADYYYHLKEVRKACLKNISQDINSQSIIPVSKELLNTKTSINESGLTISINDFSIQVTETTSTELINKVLSVITHVK